MQFKVPLFIHVDVAKKSRSKSRNYLLVAGFFGFAQTVGFDLRFEPISICSKLFPPYIIY